MSRLSWTVKNGIVAHFGYYDGGNPILHCNRTDRHDWRSDKFHQISTWILSALATGAGESWGKGEVEVSSVIKSNRRRDCYTASTTGLVRCADAGFIEDQGGPFQTLFQHWTEHIYVETYVGVSAGNREAAWFTRLVSLPSTWMAVNGLRNQNWRKWNNVDIGKFPLDCADYGTFLKHFVQSPK